MQLFPPLEHPGSTTESSLEANTKDGPVWRQKEGIQRKLEQVTKCQTVDKYTDYF